MVLTEPVGPVAVGSWLYRARFVEEYLVQWLLPTEAIHCMPLCVHRYYVASMLDVCRVAQD